jgi:DNA-binding transcriptional LysR family regulator
LESVQNAWMCSPRLLDVDRAWSLEELSAQKLLTQGNASGAGLLYQRWFATQGVNFSRTINVSNLLAQVGLAISGLGIAYLPRDCLAHLLERGDLCELSCEPSLPDAPYITLYRADRWIGVSAQIAEMAVELCNFKKLLIAR